MRRLLGVALILAPTVSNAEPFKVPPGMEKELQQAAMRLVFADGCDKRLDRPDIFKDAKSSFARVLRKANVSDAEARTDEVARTVSEAPQKKEDPSPINFFNEKLCGDLARTLKDELAKAE